MEKRRIFYEKKLIFIYVAPTGILFLCTAILCINVGNLSARKCFSGTRLRLSFALRPLVISLPGSALGMALSAAFSARLIGKILSMVGCLFLFAYAMARRIKKVAVRELIVI